MSFLLLCTASESVRAHTMYNQEVCIYMLRGTIAALMVTLSAGQWGLLCGPLIFRERIPPNVAGFSYSFLHSCCCLHLT